MGLAICNFLLVNGAKADEEELKKKSKEFALRIMKLMAALFFDSNLIFC